MVQNVIEVCCVHRLWFQSIMFASPLNWKSLLNIYYLSDLSLDTKMFFLLLSPNTGKSAVENRYVPCESLPR